MALVALMLALALTWFRSTPQGGGGLGRSRARTPRPEQPAREQPDRCLASEHVSGVEAIQEALAHQGRRQSERSEHAAAAARHATLTPREREVMTLVVAGLANKHIAAKLGTCVKTIKVHRAGDGEDERPIGRRPRPRFAKGHGQPGAEDLMRIVRDDPFLNHANIIAVELS